LIGCSVGWSIGMAETDMQLDARMTTVVNVEASIACVKNKYRKKFPLLFALFLSSFRELSRYHPSREGALIEPPELHVDKHGEPAVSCWTEK